MKMLSLNLEKPLLYAVSYTFLAASSFSSFWNFYKLQNYLSIGMIPFGLCFVTGLLGAWIYTNLALKKYLNIRYILIKFFEIIKFVTNLYALPIVIGDMYLKHDLSVDLVIAHMFLPLLGLVPCGIINFENQPSTTEDTTVISKHKLLSPEFPSHQYIDSMDFVTFISTISLSILSCMGNNVFGVIAAIVYAMTYFIISEKGQIAKCIPAEPLYIIGLGVFCGMGMKALTFYLPMSNKS